MTSEVLYSPGIYTAFAVCLVFLFILGGVSHSLAFVVLLHREHLAKELNPFLLNICIADTIALLVEFPLVFVACVNHGWSLGTVTCYMAGITGSVTGIVMLFTLSYMCVIIYHHINERDLATSSFHLSHLTNGNPVAWHRGWKHLLVIWLCACVLLLPTLVGWGSIAPQVGCSVCAPNWGAQTVAHSSYMVALTILGFALPMSIALVYLMKIYRYSTHHPSGAQPNVFSFQYVRARAQHMAAAKVVSLQVLVYLLLWLPYWVCGFVVLVSGGGDMVPAGASPGRQAAAALPWILAHVGPVFCPCVYAAMNNRFRSTVSSVMSVKRSRQVTPTINVDGKFDRSDVSDSTRPCSPNVMVPRSPLSSHEAFSVSPLVDLDEFTSKLTPRSHRKLQITLQALTQVISPIEDNNRQYNRERRNTTEI
ncbi:predicted protein [Nematostella vectensis]|uniref:G-protein coupled receptors family 1 profile domain-containing protein n=1 Tax=Nematostella vectensis TaxID=45351 RepID=A7RTL7_NEMVE|nr:predicted protein [Nematostella vectensis]|eukprot:XP_001637296.1 predicted protein [Nematostella vectensis]